MATDKLPTWRTSREDMDSFLMDGTHVVYVYGPGIHGEAEGRIPVMGPMARARAKRIADALNQNETETDAAPRKRKAKASP